MVSSINISDMGCVFTDLGCNCAGCHTVNPGHLFRWGLLVCVLCGSVFVLEVCLYFAGSPVHPAMDLFVNPACAFTLGLASVDGRLKARPWNTLTSTICPRLVGLSSLRGYPHVFPCGFVHQQRVLRTPTDSFGLEQQKHFFCWTVL